ncbi:hypothetical protein F4860DRAFT_518254 [Xylaria cubensis]|nr:hypothetical protein F4860DRAFT_518254 [Xylaria cubensis]
MSTKEDSCVPRQKILVAKFDIKVVKYTAKPKAKGWVVVRKRVDPDKQFKFRFLPEEHDAIHLIYPTISIEKIQSAFLRGYPLINLATPIYTCGTRTGRPKILYRLTHDGQPHGGMKPRGHGSVIVEPFSFHILLFKHLDWRCRNLSPFLSATDSMDKILHMYGLYDERGYQNIRLLIFRTDGPGWDHQMQKLYRVFDLLMALGGRSPKYVSSMIREFILEGEIPPESIIEERLLKSNNPRRPVRIPVPPKAKSTIKGKFATAYTSCT